MAFDANSFGQNIAGGGGLLEGLVGAFGLPTCVLQLQRAALLLIPTPVLLAIQRMINQFRSEIDAYMKEIFEEIATWLGIEEYFTEDGLAKLRAKFALTDIDFTLPARIAAFLQFAGDIYQFIQDAEQLINEIKECLTSVKNALDKPGNTTAAAYTGQANEAELALATARLEQLQIIRQQVDDFAASLADELYLRSQDPNREPAINSKYADVFGPGYKIQKEQEEEPLIRMVYGPPKSTDGKFLLSVDGLYYDSQGDEDIRPILIQLQERRRNIPLGDRWTFNYDPNLGGRGEEVSDRTFSKWANTIFDINKVDESDAIQVHYKSDTLLRTLIGQRDKRLLDINNQIEYLSNQGESQAVINNFKQSLLSEVAQLDTKVNRRKKQIEIGTKAPSIFGGSTLFEPGQVPINDFTYLQKFNISLAYSDQKSLVIDSESVSGIVLPIESKFTSSRINQSDKFIIDQLVVPDMGFDSIIRSGNATDETAPQMNMNEFVSTDGLFALYNFLNSTTVMPSSLETNLVNCVTPDQENDAFLISKSSTDFFVDLGLAAPYFKGIAEHGPEGVNALGCFGKLPDTRQFQDWTYDRANGFSFETWVYMPTLEDASIGWKDNDVSSLYRLILANENVGLDANYTRQEDYNYVPFSNGTESTRGLIFGFTIDRRWTRKLFPSNDFSDQDPAANGYGLILAPTISYDASSATFISNSKCNSADGWLGMYIPHTKATSSGKTLADCQNEYMLLDFSVNYQSDTITVYLDGEVLETSSVMEVFGIRKFDAINIPNFKQLNSFDYTERTVAPSAPKSLRYGPKLGKFFTPWILGGGYTDGYKNGGFMGGEYGGLISGLRGFLGSVKFYSKSISASEINKNYTVQSQLFKDLKWARTVILATGQSNMDAGYAWLSAVDEVTYGKTQEGIKYWDPFAGRNQAGNDWQGDWVDLTPSAMHLKSRYYRNEILAAGGNFAGTLPDFKNPATSEPSVSPALTFMTGLQKLVKKNSSIKTPVYLVNNCAPGTNMSLPPYIDDQKFQRGSWSHSAVRNNNIPVIGYTLYDTLAYDLTNALETLPKPIDLSVILYQGENEGVVNTTLMGSNDYANLSGVVAESWALGFATFYDNLDKDIKSLLKSPNQTIPWYVGRTHIELTAMDLGPSANASALGYPYNLSYHYPIVDTLRRAQTRVTEALTSGIEVGPGSYNNFQGATIYPNASLVDADGLSFINTPDGNWAGIDILGTVYPLLDLPTLHFDASGALVLGERFFDVYKETRGYS